MFACLCLIRLLSSKCSFRFVFFLGSICFAIHLISLCQSVVCIELPPNSHSDSVYQLCRFGSVHLTTNIQIFTYLVLLCRNLFTASPRDKSRFTAVLLGKIEFQMEIEYHEQYQHHYHQAKQYHRFRASKINLSTNGFCTIQCSIDLSLGVESCQLIKHARTHNMGRTHTVSNCCPPPHASKYSQKGTNEQNMINYKVQLHLNKKKKTLASTWPLSVL